MRRNGIDLNWLEERVRENDDGCWIWIGAVNQSSGLPVMNDDGTMRPVRLVVWEAVNGKKMKPGNRSFSLCGCKLCVHPDHVDSKPWGAQVKGRKRDMDVRIKIAHGQRARQKLSEDDVRDIRASVESGPVLSARYGVTKETINNIKRGDTRKDYSNPFIGLMA